MADAAHLGVKGVSKRYGAATVLESIDLDMARGELVTLLGPSGCGKTTLLRVIAGLVRADTGTLSLAGRDVTRMPPYRRNVGVVFQSYALFPHLDVAGNVAFGLNLKRLPKAEIEAKVRRVLALVHLEALAERPIRALSGGQQQRVALARALAVEPSVVLFDEALSALDRKLREAMQVELRQLLTSIGATAVFVTHDQEEALTMSDRIAVMHRGRIDQLADPRTLYDRPATSFALSFVGQSFRLSGRVVASEPGLSVIDTAAGQLRAPKQFLTGSDVIVATRPEHAHLGHATLGPGDNSLAGTVSNVTFQGPRSLVEVRIGDAFLTVQMPGRSAAPPIGSEVTVGWPIAETLIFPAEGEP
ncbi:MAG: ABC transporter ATP-binding protein [Ancalomicrobiaceae bacterium]|nr:ABC transporter ATP-binding protein [Ancalomicrobiaceae bacterium]